MPRVSIVISTFNRSALLERTLESIYAQQYRDFEVIVVDDGNDGDLTTDACRRFDVRYFKRYDRPSLIYSNPAIPNNIGVRKALGEVVILQNAECSHASEELILNLANAVGENDAVFAAVASLGIGGQFQGYYCHPVKRPAPYFFCGALKKKWFEDLRGFDEDYTGYGYDDDDFADRLMQSGVNILFTDTVMAYHQWHTPTSFNPELDPRQAYNKKLYEEKTLAMSRGEIGPIRNLGRDWGVHRASPIVPASAHLSATT